MIIFDLFEDQNQLNELAPPEDHNWDDGELDDDPVGRAAYRAAMTIKAWRMDRITAINTLASYPQLTQQLRVLEPAILTDKTELKELLNWAVTQSRMSDESMMDIGDDPMMNPPGGFGEGVAEAGEWPDKMSHNDLENMQRNHQKWSEQDTPSRTDPSASVEDFYHEVVRLGPGLGRDLLYFAAEEGDEPPHIVKAARRLYKKIARKAGLDPEIGSTDNNKVFDLMYDWVGKNYSNSGVAEGFSNSSKDYGTDEVTITFDGDIPSKEEIIQYCKKNYGFIPSSIDIEPPSNYKGLENPGIIRVKQGVAEGYTPSAGELARDLIRLTDPDFSKKYSMSKKQANQHYTSSNLKEQGVTEGSLEEIDRRGFLKGMGAAAVAGAAGGLIYNVAKKGAKDDKKFRYYVTDPKDIKHYEELQSKFRMYMELSASNKSYLIMSTHAADELDNFVNEMQKKYNFSLKTVNEQGVAEGSQDDRNRYGRIILNYTKDIDIDGDHPEGRLSGGSLHHSLGRKSPTFKKLSAQYYGEYPDMIRHASVADLKQIAQDFAGNIAEGSTDSWIVYNGTKIKRFKTYNGAKAYAEKNGGKVASSEHYYDKIQKQGVAETAKKESIAESKGRCMQCGMKDCKCPGTSCKCKPIAGWVPGKGFKKAMDETANTAQQAAIAIAKKKKQGVDESRFEYNNKTGQMDLNREDPDQRHGLYIDGKLVKTYNTRKQAENIKQRDPRFKNATIKKIAEATGDKLSVRKGPPKNVAEGQQSAEKKTVNNNDADSQDLFSYQGSEPKVRRVLARAHKELPGAKNDIEAVVGHIATVDDINMEQQRQIGVLTRKLVQAQNNYNQQERRFRDLTNKLRQQGDQATTQDIRAARAAGEIEQSLPPVNEVSRRGFLKGLGAAAATAATPGGLGKLAKAVAEPVAAVATEPAAAVASTNATLSQLFNAAVNFGMDNAGDSESIYDYNDDDDEDGNDDINWNEEYAEYQGTSGQMPYGDDVYYEALQTPEKNWYLVTTDPGGYRAVVSYIKNGEERAMMLDWDYTARCYDEVLGSADEEDAQLFNEYPGNPGNQEELGPVIDWIINGGSAKSVKPEPLSKSAMPKDPNTVRIGAVAKNLSDKFGDLSNPTLHSSDVSNKKIAALPAPTDPEFELTPNIKQKEKVSVGNPDTDHTLSAESADPRVEKSIMFRIMSNHRSLLLKYTPQRVHAAVEQVADSVGPVDEFDSNNVTAWVHQVEQVLGGVSEARAVKTRLDPACWPGKKIGKPKTKVKGGVRVNNCVPK